MDLNNYEKLVYNLIFSDSESFEINIGDYIEDIYNYDGFMEKIENILEESKVMILENEVDIKSDEIIWILKVKK